MKAYKLEVLVIDPDGLGPDGIASALETARYPSRCVSPKVMVIYEKEIGEWRDDHPLNNLTTRTDEFFRLFPPAEV